MRVRAFFNSVKEGFRGIVRHPLVTIASITTILLMLFIMGVFFIFSVNVRTIMTRLSQRPPIEVYMKLQCTEEELNDVQAKLYANPNIMEFHYASPEDNYNSYKANLGSSASLLDDFDYNMYLPHTFSIRLTDPSTADQVCAEVATYNGVSKVQQESNVMKFLTKSTRIVNIATLVSFVVLFIISLFIISNMVRISVYSRASEIEIMKFVGATNGFIRMPYVTEGAIVGLLSALIAWGVTVFAYDALYSKLMGNTDPSSFYALLPVGSLMWTLLVMVIIFGVVIGAVGSGISVRKYIKV